MESSMSFLLDKKAFIAIIMHSKFYLFKIIDGYSIGKGRSKIL